VCRIELHSLDTTARSYSLLRGEAPAGASSRPSLCLARRPVAFKSASGAVVHYGVVEVAPELLRTDLWRASSDRLAHERAAAPPVASPLVSLVIGSTFTTSDAGLIAVTSHLRVSARAERWRCGGA
jgi:hypothetical protein